MKQQVTYVRISARHQPAVPHDSMLFTEFVDILSRFGIDFLPQFLFLTCDSPNVTSCTLLAMWLEGDTFVWVHIMICIVNYVEGTINTIGLFDGACRFFFFSRNHGRNR